jgi:transposase
MKYTIDDFNNKFPDDDSCLDWLRKKLYPNRIYCPNCKKPTKHHKITERPVYGCDYCGHQISPMAHTIFQHSSTPLRLWFYAIYLMSSTRCGISAKQLQRETGVTYKTAWRMFKQIRKLLQENNSVLKLDQVEVDETYIGGKRTGKRGRGASGKSPVVGIAERRGLLSATHTQDCKSSTIFPMINRQVAKEATIYTDEYCAYDTLNKKLGYNHIRIQHNTKVYVIGEAHTNTIEGFWSLLKRGITGVYHSVSEKYVQNYIDEYGFRYNHRKDESPMFINFLAQITQQDRI